MPYNAGTKEAEKQFGVGGNAEYFKFEPGPNRIRLLAEAKKFFATHFVGGRGYTCFRVEDGCPFHGTNAPVDDEGKPRNPSAKKMAYVLNRKTGTIQLAEIPYSVVHMYEKLSEDPDWDFAELPMPYDITVNYDKPNKKYTMQPSPKREDLAPEILEELGLKKTLEQITESKIARARQEAIANGTVVLPEGETAAVVDDDEPPAEDDGDLSNIPF